MNLVDVHCHLNHDKFKNDLDKVLRRAEKAGVKAIVVSGINHPANKEVLELAEKSPLIKVSLGIYPIDALGLSDDETGLPRQTEKIDLDKEFKFIEENKSKIVAVGEVGMDFYWDQEHHEQQKEIFKKIIRFVKKIKKPIVIHSRKAEHECLDILEEEISDKKEIKGKEEKKKKAEKKNKEEKKDEDEIPVILHCFSGNKKLIKRAADLGYYFSIPPNIVRLQHFQTLVEMVPLEQLFTETDAPWLSPFKDRKNEPAFVVEAVRKIAEIKGITKEKAAGQIWNNYQKVFI